LRGSIICFLSFDNPWQSVPRSSRGSPTISRVVAAPGEQEKVNWGLSGSQVIYVIELAGLQTRDSSKFVIDTWIAGHGTYPKMPSYDFFIEKPAQIAEKPFYLRLSVVKK
jgi:hypothetical protein